MGGNDIKAVTAIDNPYYGHHEPGQIPAFIHSQGTNVMLADGMGQRAVNFFQEYGIQVATGAAGSISESLQHFLSDELSGVASCLESQHHHHHHD